MKIQKKNKDWSEIRTEDQVHFIFEDGHSHYANRDCFCNPVGFIIIGESRIAYWHSDVQTYDHTEFTHKQTCGYCELV